MDFWDLFIYLRVPRIFKVEGEDVLVRRIRPHFVARKLFLRLFAWSNIRKDTVVNTPKKDDDMTF
jgi:hypothetical protein